MTSSYSADRIQVLEGLEPVRKRPGMYIGTTGPRGLHHLVYEVVDNSIDEALAGYCTHIEIDLNADGSVTVTDNGRGIPTDIHRRTGKSALETVMTVFHAGRKFGGGGYKVSGGLHGVSISVVNALSEWVEVTVWREKQIYTQRYERGIPVTDLIAKTSEENRTGTSVAFKPDAEIFKTGTEFDSSTLAGRLREVAYLNAGIKITFTDNRLEVLKSTTPKIETYCYKGGIREYIAYLNHDKQPLHEEIIYIQGDRNDVHVEVALQWCIVDKYIGDADILWGFANIIRTVDGGTHVEALKVVLSRCVNALRSKRNKRGENVPEGLTAVISVKVPNPEFAGSMKTRLSNIEVQEIVESLVGDAIAKYLESHPDVALAIVEQAIQSFNALRASRQARRLLRKNLLVRTTDTK